VDARKDGSMAEFMHFRCVVCIMHINDDREIIYNVVCDGKRALMISKLLWC